MISAVAVVGRRNNPLYIRNFTTEEDLKFHYVVNTSLDVVEEKVSNAKSSEMYLGLLYTMEDMKVYGYITNTKIKFIVVITSSETLLKDSDIRNVFSNLHSAYIKLVCNPFFNPENNSMASSKYFDQTIQQIVQMAQKVDGSK